MPLAPREFAAELLAEARETHPWLHHRLFRLIGDGKLSREQVRNVVREQGAFFLDTLRHAAWKIISVGGFTPRPSRSITWSPSGWPRPWKSITVCRAATSISTTSTWKWRKTTASAHQILSKIALTDQTQARDRLALRRAITVRRLCADGMYEAFVAAGRS